MENKLEYPDTNDFLKTLDIQDSHVYMPVAELKKFEAFKQKMFHLLEEIKEGRTLVTISHLRWRMDDRGQYRAHFSSSDIGKSYYYINDIDKYTTVDDTDVERRIVEAFKENEEMRGEIKTLHKELSLKDTEIKKLKSNISFKPKLSSSDGWFKRLLGI